jgi:dihydrofolate reductase
VVGLGALAKNKGGHMHIFLIAAISVDGFIGQAKEQVSTAWTSKEDKQFFVQRTKEAGLMVLGSQTFRTFNRLMPGRSMIIYTRDVEQFRQSVEFEVEEVTAATTVLDRADILYATKLEPKELVSVLEKCGKKELAVCGGSSIYWQFVNAGLVETLYLTVEPMLFGKGVPLFSEALQVQLELRKQTSLSPQTLLLEYAVHRH